ncbi:MAG: hypothetical protein IKM48_03115 [Clostridia bacterium]|nr:hypothetical protein [Clostridia bacterium]
MPYTKVSWVDEKTPLCADNLNHMEDGIENAQAMVEAVEKRTTEMEETTVPALAEKTAYLLGDSWGPIVVTHLDGEKYDVEDPLFNLGGLFAIQQMSKRNQMLGKDPKDENQRYFVIDSAKKELLYVNANELVEAIAGIRNPVVSFAALQMYDPESKEAMSGIAVEEALAALRKSIPDLVLEKFPNLDEVSY